MNDGEIYLIWNLDIYNQPKQVQFCAVSEESMLSQLREDFPGYRIDVNDNEIFIVDQANNHLREAFVFSKSKLRDFPSE